VDLFSALSWSHL